MTALTEPPPVAGFEWHRTPLRSSQPEAHFVSGSWRRIAVIPIRGARVVAPGNATTVRR